MGASRQARALTEPRAAQPWAARIGVEEALAAAALRLLAGVEVAESGAVTPMLWLRGPDLTDEIDAALRRVPGLERFRLLPGDLLAEPEARVPGARLPLLTWKPIAQQFVPRMPAPSSEGDRPGSVRVRVVVATAERPAAALLTDAVAWEAWCSDAAAIRLRRLRFAASRDGRVLVRGEPLPPIPGAIALWDDVDVLVPCGHAPEPDVGGVALRVAFGLADGDVALLGVDGAFEVVPGANFAAASRSAARLTRSGLAGG